MKLNEIINYLNSVCPPAYQESYDNCGLLTGNADMEIKDTLLTLDCTEDVVNEAIKLKCNLIISHHPVIFTPIKKFTGDSFSQRVIITAIKHDIAIYAMHTNLDNIYTGVNHKIAGKLGLKNLTILAPKRNLLKKLVTFCPRDKADEVRNAIFEAGSGEIGNYNECSFNSPGIGTFKAGKNANPYVGAIGERHYEKEERIETIYPAYREAAIVKALLDSHPYEEVAYDLYSLDNAHPYIGSGMLGELEEPVKEMDFLKHIKKIMKCSSLRYGPLRGIKISKVAVCGGSGSFLLPDAIGKGADMFVTSDFKYHQFFDAENKIVVADIGHYESEQYTPEIIYGLLKEKFNTFALRFSKINSNPINYL